MHEMDGKVPVMAVARHRIGIDGTGVHTLVCFPGCPLSCRLCINPETTWPEDRFPHYTPEGLLKKVKVDDLYFHATGGGITFGGGEPALRADFIARFRTLCDWKIDLETSLNVPSPLVERLLEVTDHFFVDIKDMDPDVYRSYTGKDNAPVLENLRLLAPRADDCTLRLPLIPGYNTDAHRDRSEAALREMGFNRFDRFNYKTDIRHGKRKTDL